MDEILSISTKKKDLNWTLLRCLVASICSSILLLSFSHIYIPLGMQGTLATLIQVFCAFPFYVGAKKEILDRKLHINSLIALATTISYLFSFYLIFTHPTRGTYFELSSLLISIILLGKIVEMYNRQKGEKAVLSLLDFRSKTARILKDHDFCSIPVENLNIGDTCLVEPWETIPIDGIVIKGSSSVDESMGINERTNIKKEQNSSIFAGSVNKQGTLYIKVTQTSSKSSLNRVLSILKASGDSTIPLQNSLSKISYPLVSIAIVLAVFTWLGWGFFENNFLLGFINAITVLTIACPTALSLAIPIVGQVCSSKAALNGIFIKEFRILEKASKIKKLCIDKNAILVENAFEIETLELDHHYFPIIKTLCEHSDSTGCKTILEYLNKKNVPTLPTMQVFRFTYGEGISGYFDGRNYFLGSISYLEQKHCPIDAIKKHIGPEREAAIALGTEKLGLGYFILSQKVRNGTKEALEMFKKKGIETILLPPPDPFQHETRLAEKLGFDHVLSGSLEHKLKFLKGKNVALFAGEKTDPNVVAAADVSFAPISSDSTIVLLRTNLETVLETVSLSKIAHKKILQNTIFAVAYNILGLPLAAFGWVNPIVAAVAMTLSTLFVIFNGLQIYKNNLNS